ncbi:MAG: hypothetical protein KAI57_01880 [Candidatus Pacebacteria bacterium]|nr:hypothetical protein [Candidatus Paceibacterota bacterium]
MQRDLLKNLEVIRWCFCGITEKTTIITSNKEELKKANIKEKLWGNSIMGTESNNQWTTKLCEELVEEALIMLGRKNVRKTIQKSGMLRKKKYSPDLECDDFVYEVKGRSWTTTGTAGEKILGVPLKYGEVPRLYEKPLQIVLVGYQEYEARDGFQFGDLLDPDEQTDELRESLAFYKDNDIEYIGFTDILKKIGFLEDCWKKK